MGMWDFFMDVIVAVETRRYSHSLASLNVLLQVPPKPALNILLYLQQFAGVDFTF